MVLGGTKNQSRRSKVKTLEEALKKESEKSNEYLNRLKYLQADFENYRKRVDKEVREIAQLSKEKLILNLLNVIDELELALNSGKKTKNNQVLLEGVEMTLKKLFTILEQEGLIRIKAVGQPFDPLLHEVLMKVPPEEYADNVIIEEVRKGFMLRNKVIRPSIVKIATEAENFE